MKRFGIALLFVAVLIIPQTSHAYGLERGTAVRLNDHMLLYLISFEFGHKKYDYRVPITAVRGASEGSVGYDIVTDTGLRTSVGKTSAVVLSSAKVKDGMYVVPKRTKATFTLVTVLNLPKGYTASSTAFATRVNSLPFELGKDGSFNKNGLSEGELAPFMTLPVDVNAKPQ
jgi:hypothetical protein